MAPTADGRRGFRAGIAHTFSCMPARQRVAALWLVSDLVQSLEKCRSLLLELLLASRSAQQLRLESLRRPFHRARGFRAPQTSRQTKSSHPGYPPAGFASFSVLLLQITLEPRDPSLVSLEVANPLQHCADNQRQRYRRIIENFREFSALFRWNKLAPRNGLRVRAAAQPAPMYRFRADPQTVVIALQRELLVTTPRQQLRVHAELLRPVARHAAAHRENPHPFRRQHRIREFLEVLKGIEPQQRSLVSLPGDLVQREVDAQLRIAERRDEYRNIVLVRGLQNSPPRHRLVKILADAPVNFPAANDVLGIPLIENFVHDLFDVVEIDFRLQRIVNAVVAGVEQLPVVHFD